MFSSQILQMSTSDFRKENQEIIQIQRRLKGFLGALVVKKEKVKVKSFGRVRVFATPWTIAHQAPPSMGFFGQESWSGLPFPSPAC